MSTPDLAQLSETQQTALQTYLAVTDQDPLAAIPILQRSEWNVQIAISRFFDGEPTSNPLAEEAAVPAPSSRQTANLEFESLIAATSRPSQNASPENVVRRVDTTSSMVPVYRPPFLLSALFTPFNLIFRLFSTILSPLSFLIPSFASRIIQNLLTSSSRPTRRQLPPADTARRFIREFEETYTPNPPLPFVESGFNLALDQCKQDGKFLLAILISPSHDETHSWVRETLLSSQFHQFLQTHLNDVILWGGSVQDAEGYQVSTSLNCSKFPFAALICQSGDRLGGGSRPTEMCVVMRAAGPLSATELIAKLGSAITAQQAQLASVRAQRAEQQASRSLRQEQDSAYERSLAQDRERARARREEEQAKILAEKHAHEAAELAAQRADQKEQWQSWRTQQLRAQLKENESGLVAVSIRMPNGQRLIQKFNNDSPLEHLYAFVECQDLLNTDTNATSSGAYPEGYKHDFTFKLVSPMPRSVIDIESGGTIGSRVGRGANLIVEEAEDSDDDEE